MSTKINFDQFLETVDAQHQTFVLNLHNYLLENACKVTFEEKKNGFLASYKYGKPPKSVLNFLFRKNGMLVRIYGENIIGYADFLDTLPAEMEQSIDNSGECKRLVHNTCSPKCTGYDFTIRSKYFQKCRYCCFEFLVTNENNPYIKSFIENELKERKLSAEIAIKKTA